MSEEIEGARSASGWKDFLAAAFLIAAVGAILLTGWVLKGERPVPDPRAAEAPADVTLGSKITPEPAPWDAPEPARPPVAEPRDERPVEVHREPAAEPSLDGLARRAAADASRLGDAGGAWTAQILVACRPETVERLIAASAGAGDLYVLPAELNGASCFRACWGVYASRAEAATAANLPAALRGKDTPRPAEIAKVLP